MTEFGKSINSLLNNSLKKIYYIIYLIIIINNYNKYNNN